MARRDGATYLTYCRRRISSDNTFQAGSCPDTGLKFLCSLGSPTLTASIHLSTCRGTVSFRYLENSVNHSAGTTLTEFEHAFVYYAKGFEASRYFSFVELGQDIPMTGASDMSIAALTALVAELPYATVTGRYKPGDSFEVDQAAVTTRRSPEPQSSPESDQDEERAQAEPPRWRCPYRVNDAKGQVQAGPSRLRWYSRQLSPW